MAGQPLNSAITTQMRVRTFRQDLKHESVRAVCSNGFRAHLVQIPGEEVLVGQTRETLSAGESPILATSMTAGRTTGLPVCIVPEATMTLTQLLTATDSDYDGVGAGKAVHRVDYPVRLPGCRDMQFHYKTAYNTRDIHGDVRGGHATNP